ncbi:phenylacetate-CoA ligase [Paucidesulfovibrio gracilis DSM 16080]|uniref:Phenylacetate-coenzyme A ligase n=1 Tax=Paucidesulfovibrio gracilis DSM 16080 TaxID=1121449 RepID=A0A1T4WT93_9BACT|nr:phenylacetate--CoA ligase [Paucidesulfovibrio gracilis]SKA80337.1 phenylacetate-CoA ligase [Paucidesulfovibrio gracilis DSM 16080]
MIFDVEHETMPREDLEKLQLRRLKALVERVYHNVPFYKKRLEEKGIRPGDINSLDDVRHLPFTEKQDLRNNYPYGLFAVNMENIVRIHSSSGTTGKATVVGYTHRDVRTWASLMGRCLNAAGVGPGDILHNAYGYGLFTGGLGAHYGAEAAGATVIPMSGGATRRQIMIIKDFMATAICCTPSYALHLAETAGELGIDFRKLPLKVGIFGAEPWSEAMRKDIEGKLNIKALDIYGLSEIMGPGVGIECAEAQNGLHMQEDHFLLEVIDPASGEPVQPGELGELVITTLTKEAIPLLRYRTRDLTRLETTPCRCGRTTARMMRVQGRSDDMLIIRGVNVFPQQIESILLDTDGLAPHYQLVVDRKGPMDTLTVRVEVSESVFSDEIKGLQSLEKKVQGAIKEFLGVTAAVKLVEPKGIERSMGKAQRIIDLRKEAK